MIRKWDLHDQPRIMSIIHDAVTDMESKGIFQWDSYYPNKEVINEI